VTEQDFLAMNLLSWQINQPVTLSFTKSFAWPKSSFGDFPGEGGRKGHPPTPRPS